MGRKHTHKVTVPIYTTKKMLNSQCAALLLPFYHVQRTVVCCPHIFEWVHYYLLHDEHVVVVVFFTLTDRASTICLCVFFPSILDIKFVGRTSRGHTGGRSHRIFSPPSFCGACLDFCREKDSAIHFPRRP